MHAVVLAGGAGSRFWPASRRRAPKPFVPLLGDETLLERTLARLAALAPPERTWVVAARELAAPARAALRRRPGAHLLLEPLARDTAAAVAWASARIAAVEADAIVGVFPADHHIPDRRRFLQTIRAAARAARRVEALVLIGIVPTRPDPAYGYIRLAGAGPASTRRVRGFLEKPDAARARRLLASGGCLWNAGMVVAQAGVVLRECEAHAPEVWRRLGAVLVATAARRRVGRAALERGYRGVRPISFDRAVLERTRELLAVPGRFRWSDLGSWDALGEALPRVGGNRVTGMPPAAALDARDNIVWNMTDQAVALLGVEGLVLVNTRDALLVCPKGRAQEVRRIVDELGRRRRGDLT